MIKESLHMNSWRKLNKLRQIETNLDETDVQEKCLRNCHLNKEL